MPPTPPHTPPQALTDSDWELLEALWETGPATARALADHLRPTRNWAYSTVKTLLDRMATKGLVHARQVGNVWEYSAAVQAADARRSAWQRFIASAFGGAIDPALRFIASDARLSRKQRESLLAMLRDEAGEGRKV